MTTPTHRKYIELVEKELDTPGLKPERQRELMAALRAYEEMQLEEQAAEHRTTALGIVPPASNLGYEAEFSSEDVARFVEGRKIQEAARGRMRYGNPVLPPPSEQRR